MALLALCGEKRELVIRKVPLSAGMHQVVTELFDAQEEAFRKGYESPFDQNWKNEDNEISTAPIPDGMDVFDRITQASDTALEPVINTEEIRGLVMRPDDRILVQAFAVSQSLARPGYLSLFFEGGTYTRLESPGFKLGDKLVCIVEDSLIKFRSIYSLGRVIDTTTIFSEATSADVEAFAKEHVGLFEITDVESFVDNSNRNARKYIASLISSGVLSGHTVESLHNEANSTKLKISLDPASGKIVMPNGSKDIAELMQFLNDGRYIGPISKTALVTNSRKPA